MTDSQFSVLKVKFEPSFKCSPYFSPGKALPDICIVKLWQPPDILLFWKIYKFVYFNVVLLQYQQFKYLVIFHISAFAKILVAHGTNLYLIYALRKMWQNWVVCLDTSDMDFWVWVQHNNLLKLHLMLFIFYFPNDVPT